MKSLPTTPPRRALPNFSSKSPTAVVDYETYWSEDYSVSSMSYWHYAHHPDFDAYLVSIVTSDGLEWAGAPSDAPWDKIRDHVWVSHNRPFDEAVHTALQEKGVVPVWDPHYWGNSINLCAWIRVPRHLSGAVGVLFNHKMSKTIRDVETKGVRSRDFSEDLLHRMKLYALEDGRWPLRIWTENCDDWPMKERRISDMIDDRGVYGMCVDRPGMEKDAELMQSVIDVALRRLPWMTDEKIADLMEGKKVTVLSKKECSKACAESGIPAPESLAMDDERLIKWEEVYGDRAGFVAAMRDYRRMNGMLKKYQRILSRVKPNNRFEFSVAYLGTHTGRTSGRDRGAERKREGANMLNLPRDPYYVSSDLSVFSRKDDMKRISAWVKDHGAPPDDVAHSFYLRGRIVPGPGMKFGICDKSQIEARITNWMARDTKTLNLIRSGVSVYEAHARNLMGYVPPTNPDGTPRLNKKGKPVTLKDVDPGLYALAKARELALGFQAGHVRFIDMAPMYVSDEEFNQIFDKPYTLEEEVEYLSWLERTKQKEYVTQFNSGDDYLRRIRIQSWKQVNDFRSKKPSLCDPKNGLWARFDSDIKASAAARDTYEIELPSGRVLRYFNCTLVSGQVRCRVERGGDFRAIYGGSAVENAAQAFARDVFVDDQINLYDLYIHTILDIYDEVVTEIPIEFDGKSVIEGVMSTPPEWCKTLPVGAEYEESLFYKK